MTEREAFLAERLTGIGGSDAPAVLGVLPNRGPMSVYLDKIGQGVEIEESEPMYWGKAHEPAIINRYQETWLASFVEHAPSQLRSEEYPWMICHLDGWAHFPTGNRVPLEIKTSRSSLGWGADGTDKIPDAYLIQCNHNMIVSKSDIIHVPALFAGSEYRTYVVRRNEQLCDLIIEKERELWQAIQEKNPPNIGGDEASTEYLKQKYGLKGNALFINRTEAFDALVAEYRVLKASTDESEARMEVVKNLIREAIGYNDGIDCPDYRVTWNYLAGRKSIDWKAVASECGIPQSVIDKHTQIGESNRVLRVTLRGEE